MTIFHRGVDYDEFGCFPDPNTPIAGLMNKEDFFRSLEQPNPHEPLFNAEKQFCNGNCLGSFVCDNIDHKLGIYIGRQTNPYIYRGENKLYKDFVPSAQRNKQNTNKKKAQQCIDWIKKQEFIEFFKSTPYFSRIDGFTVYDFAFHFDFEALAQHYEFISDYIDITTFLNTAMFFAYSYYNKEEKCYKPISDFNKYKPTLYIANLVDIYKACKDDLKLIGFQAAYRPRLQHAMAIDVSNNKNIEQHFHKVNLPRDAHMAREIFENFNNGSSLLPNDFLSIKANQIRTDLNLNEKYFAEYCKDNNLEENKYKKIITKLGYQLNNVQYTYNKFDDYMMNREIDDYMFPFLNNNIAVRGKEWGFTFSI